MVYDFRIAYEVYFPAGRPEPEAPVDFVGVQRKSLVEQADLLDRGRADRDGRSHHPIHLARNLMAEPFPLVRQ